MRRILISLVCSLLAGGLVIGGVALVGKLSRDHLRDRNSFTIRVSDIDVNAPPEGSRELLLAELQYEGVLEDRINLHDEGLAERLGKAFRTHPRVAEVERVTIGPGNAVHVKLRYRVAVLAVPVNGVRRTIDVDGILLPPSIRTDGLLVFREKGVPLPPLVDSGNTWADKRMLRASRTAALLRAETQLGLATIATDDDGSITLGSKGGTLISWGMPPDEEEDGEPAAHDKLARLRSLWRQHGDLDHLSSAEANLRHAP